MLFAQVHSLYPACSYIIIVGACYTIAIHACIIIVHVSEGGSGRWMEVEG